MGCHFFLQGIFPTQGSNPGLPHCRLMLYHLSHQESPKVMFKILQQHMKSELPDLQAGFRKAEEPEIKLPPFTGSLRKQQIPEKHLLLFYWLHQSLWLCGSQQTVENSERDGNTRSPDLLPEKSVCKSGSNSYSWTWNNRLVSNQERSMSRLYIATLLI